MGNRGGGGQIQTMIPFTPVVKALVITCSVIWLFGQLIIDRFFLGGQFFTTYFALIPSFVVQKFFIWQLVTYAFLHSASPFHIILNLLALWWLGSELEQRWGAKFFLTYYLVCAAGAAFLYVTIVLGYALSGGSVTVMLTPVMGASGAIFGLLLAYGMIFGERIVYFMMMFPMKAKYFVMILGGIEVVNLINTGVAGSEVASLAHLGGVVSGYLFLLLHKKLQQKKWRDKGAGKSKSGKLKLVINNDKKKDDPKILELDFSSHKIYIGPSYKKFRSPMSLKKDVENLKFDKRMIDWNVSRNVLSQEELKKHLSELPDSSHNLASIELNEEVEQDMFSTPEN